MASLMLTWKVLMDGVNFSVDAATAKTVAVTDGSGSGLVALTCLSALLCELLRTLSASSLLSILLTVVFMASTWSSVMVNGDSAADGAPAKEEGLGVVGIP